MAKITIATQTQTMDGLYCALSLFRRRNFDKCAELCTELLEKQPLDQTVWCLKMRALTQRVYVDDIESEDLADAGDFFDENAVATAPRPGTSIKTAQPPPASAIGLRPRTSTGRPISGMNRPGTQTGPGSALDRLKTARTSLQTARQIRLGTAAMYSAKDGPFIQVSRLNIAKYALNPALSKPLFEYLFHHEGDVRNAMELAVQATQAANYDDWWWKVQLGKCYVHLNLIRDAEQQFRSALKQHKHVETFVRLIRVYLRLDQPLSAVDVAKGGLEAFPSDVTVMTELARLYEALGDAPASVKFYRSVVIEDATNTEAIACIGMYHFYNNQPELALRYYRRVLAMGAHSSELYNNLGLCCLYAQQLDLTLACFERALEMADEMGVKAEVWFNLSHLGLAAGDLELAMQCLKLCLSCDSSHAAAFNNLAVLNHKMGKIGLAKGYFASAKALESGLYEPTANLEQLENI